MLELRQSTFITLKIGPFLDETDGKTAETGLTITQGEVRLSKNGGNMAQKTEVTACTHDELGVYGCPLDTTDTGTLGRLQLWVHESGALPVWHEYGVITQQDWDSKYGADKLQVDAVEVSGDSTAADNLELACDNYSVTRGLSGTALPAAAADTAGGLPVSDAGGLDFDTKLANTNEVTAARMDTLTDWIDGGRLDLLLDAIKAVTDALPDGGALTNISLNTARLTAARAGVLTDWINGGRLDLILDIIAADVVNLDGDAMRGTNSAALAASYTAARAGYLDELEAANLPADVDTLLTRITADRAGYWDELAAPNLPADIDTLLARITVARAVYLDELEAGNLPADVDTLLTRVTAAVALASVCTEARLAELDAGNLPTDIANVPTEAEMNARTLVAAGYFDPAVDTVAGVTTVVNLTNAPTAGDLTAIMKASVNTEADTALTDYDGPTNAEMDAAHALLATPAQVNTEVLDVLNVDVFAEPGQGAPAATTTLQEKLAYLYKFARNKLLQNATTLEVYDDAGVVVDQKATVSDDGVDFIRGKIGSGP